MSGEYLRACATQGDSEEVWRLLKERANACSTDKYGLTALHYAVWNGHVECVKYLVCNSWGVDKSGKRGHALNLVSVLGLSPLHLAAQDCPHWAAKEITELLLMAGVDSSLRDNAGRVAWEYAKLENNTGALEAFETYKELQTVLETREIERMSSVEEEAESVLGEIGVNDALVAAVSNSTSNGTSTDDCDMNDGDGAVVNLISKLPLELYFDDVVSRCTRSVDPVIDRVAIWESEGPQFPAPSFMARRVRCGRLPTTAKILERHIKPMVLYSEKLSGIKSYRGMEFAKREGEANKARRELLLQAADPTWKPVEDSELPDKSGKQSRKLGRSSK